MTSSDHAVIIHFSYGSTDLSKLFTLEDELIIALEAVEAGEFDGDEMAVDGSDGYLYMYGPDADKLFNAVRPILESADFMKGAKIKLRYGSLESGSREVNIEISSY